MARASVTRASGLLGRRQPAFTATAIPTTPIARNVPQCAAFATSKKNTIKLSAIAPIASLISGGTGRLRSRSVPSAKAVSSVNAAPDREERICIQQVAGRRPALQQDGVDAAFSFDQQGRGDRDFSAQED